MLCDSYTALIFAWAYVSGLVWTQSHGKLIWGWLRLFLGFAQLWLAGITVILLVTTGLRPATLVVAVAAGAATVLSRILYRGRSSAPITKGENE